MELAYKPQVIKQLKKLSNPEKTKIIKKFELLLTSPLSGKLLKGELEGFRSVRVWPFRIIYSLQKNKIIVYSVAHRQGVYKN